MKKFKIIASHDVDTKLLISLKKGLGKKYNITKIDFREKKNVLEKIEDMDIFITKYYDLPYKFYSKLQNLKLIHLTTSDYSKINIKLAKKNKVKVANNQGANSVSVAEHIIMLVMIFYRNFLSQEIIVNKGRWNNLKHKNLELFGKSIGIVGMGHVGYQLMKLSKSLGMEVFYNDIKRKSKSFEKKYQIKFQNLSNLLKKKEIISLNVSLTEKSRNLINKKQMSIMNKDAILINTSRGNVLNEKELIKHLKKNKFFKAGLDVFESEPLSKKNPLIKAKNVLLTPHCGPSKESYEKLVNLIIRNIINIYKGRKINNL